MKIGSLFSGGGLGDLGFMMAGCEIVFQVEIDEYCQKVLNLRWPDVPKWRDIHEIKGKDLPKCDIITGGFPCQPFSVAGKQNGKSDNRYLWPEMFRIISEVKPTWVIAENVPGIIGIALDDVLNDLESKGYETITLVFPAHALGAWHKRDRLWIIANNRCFSSRTGEESKEQRDEITNLGKTISDSRLFGQKINEIKTMGTFKCSKDVANSSSKRLEEQELQLRHSIVKQESNRIYWSTEPDVGRVANGVPSRVDRLKCIGNGQVPFVTKWIAERIIEYDTQNLRRQ